MSLFLIIKNPILPSPFSSFFLFWQKRFHLCSMAHKKPTTANVRLLSLSRTARDSKPMEVLGTYDPVPRVPLATDTPDTVDNHETDLPRPLQKRYKKIQLDTSRTKYWLGVGAQPSEPVWRLLSMVSQTFQERWKPCERLGANECVTCVRSGCWSRNRDIRRSHRAGRMCAVVGDEI